jgi:hypothetical protein
VVNEDKPKGQAAVGIQSEITVNAFDLKRTGFGFGFELQIHDAIRLPPGCMQANKSCGLGS